MTGRSSRTTGFFAAAAALGVLHAAFSGYWAAGGRWMLATVGSFAVDWVETDPVTARSVLLGLTLVKLAAAVLPLLAYLGRVPLPRTIFAISWVGAGLLVLWGGLSFVGAAVGLLLSADNQTVKVGHLFFDGAFLLWGAALLLGLRASRM